MFEFLKKLKKKPEEAPEEKPVKEEKKAEKPVEVNPPKEEPKEAKDEKKEEEIDDDDERNGPYFVSPHPDGGWQVKRTKAKRALKRFDTKAEAEEYAKTVAKNQDTHIIRQKKDGKIQKKH